MLIAPSEPAVVDATPAAQNETAVSDIEISRRVMKIRSSWTLGERLRRRREAESRFADLLAALTADPNQMGADSEAA